MVEINQQFQDLHVRNSDYDRWVELQQIERDICLLYHQLSVYSYIMGDLYYGSVYAHRYWNFLDVEGIGPDRQLFIRQGCLVLILAMSWDMIDDSGTYLHPHLTDVSAALRACSPDDEDTQKLLAAAKLGVALASEEQIDTAKLVELSKWVHHKFIRGYFRDIAQDFDNNPYFKEHE